MKNIRYIFLFSLVLLSVIFVPSVSHACVFGGMATNADVLAGGCAPYGTGPEPDLTPLGSSNPSVLESQSICLVGTQPWVDAIGHRCYTGRQISNGNTISAFCTGTETSGSCMPSNIDQSAATAEAVWKYGPGCVGVKNGFPGIEESTGLSYFYSVSCPSGSAGGTGTSGTGGSTGTSGSGTTSTGVSGTAGTDSTLDTLGSDAINAIVSGKSSDTTGGQIVADIKQQISNRIKDIIAQYNLQLGIALKAVTPPNQTLNVTTEGSNSCPTALTSDLRKGDSGSQVTTLATILVGEGLLSQPQSTFDDTVYNAVISFQEKHANSILTPVGLTKGSGFVGPSTRNYINSNCGSNPLNTAGNTSITTPLNPSVSVPAGTKTSGFSYKFTKTGNAWTVTLDNAPLGTPTDFFYIPTNYSITAISAFDLNMQAQGRFNIMARFPGTPSGNTFYSQMFGAFEAAFYDWDKQTNTTSSSNSSPTVDSLTANGFQSISVKVGDTVNYAWGSKDGTSYDSYYRANTPDTCVGGFASADITKPWVASNANGSISQTVQSCQAGVTYTIAYRIHHAAGTLDAIKTVIISVTK